MYEYSVTFSNFLVGLDSGDNCIETASLLQYYSIFFVAMPIFSKIWLNFTEDD